MLATTQIDQQSSAALQTLLTCELPQATSSYAPIPHGTLIDECKKMLGMVGYTILKETYYEAQEGQVMTAAFLLDHENVPSSQVKPMFAIQNSYNKAKRVRFVAGAGVFVCSNMMLAGEIDEAKLHRRSAKVSTDMKIDEVLDMAWRVIGRLGRAYENTMHDVKRMKNRKLCNADIYQLVGQLYFGLGILRDTQASQLRRDLETNPDFALNSPERMNMWNFYNCVTQVMKTTHASHMLKKYKQLHEAIMGWMDGEFSPFKYPVDSSSEQGEEEEEEGTVVTSEPGFIMDAGEVDIRNFVSSDWDDGYQDDDDDYDDPNQLDAFLEEEIDDLDEFESSFTGHGIVNDDDDVDPDQPNAFTVFEKGVDHIISYDPVTDVEDPVTDEEE